VVTLMMVLSAALLLVPYVQNLVIILFLFAWTSAATPPLGGAESKSAAVHKPSWIPVYASRF
jgi:hypothetical protein